MKFVTVLLTAACLSASAIGHSQKVSLDMENVPIQKVFRELIRQTGVSIICNAKLIEGAKPVTIRVTNATVDEVIGRCLQALPLTYSLEGNSIVIKEKPKTPQIGPTESLITIPPIDVRGRVLNEDGEPVEGAAVKVKGTNIGTSTNSNGEFSLKGIAENAILVFSGVNIETTEIKVNGKNDLAVSVKNKVTNLQDVVINKGYYTEKKKLSTGDVSVVTAKEIEEQPVSDPVMALEGRVPGMQITQASGIPGSNFTIYIRGKNSISNGNQPLYIVDGVPFISYSLTTSFLTTGAVGSGSFLAPYNGQGGGLSPFNNLNPEDIETIEVLKDADATAIYGSRGANGVVLITTKKGRAGTTRVDVNLNSGIGRVDRMIPFLNTQQYLQMRKEAFKNDGVLPGTSDYDLNGTWDSTRYTDWEKFLIGNNSHFTNADFSVSGGTANTQFALGAAYSKQTTVFPGNYYDQKASMHFNLNHSSTNQKFTVLFTGQYIQDNNVVPSTDFTKLIQNYAPDAPALYDANGNINWQNGSWYNPMAYTLQTYRAITNNLVSQLSLGYNILKNLRIQTQAGYTRIEMTQNDLIPANSFYGVPNANNRRNWMANNYVNTWIVEPQINYSHDIGKGKLDMLVGSSIQRNVNSSIGFYGTGFTNDALIGNISNAPTLNNFGSGYTDYRYSAVYGRLNYNWSDRYVVNITGRRDGSSRFGPGKQFGNFGAAGVAWIFSNEKFIDGKMPFLSFGKLRASYGTTGSDQIIDYQYLSTYSITGNYQSTSGLLASGIANPYFAWEIDKKLEAGINLGFFQNRVNIEANYYRNRSGNQLVSQVLPSPVGFGSVQANLPAVVQNKGFEFLVNTFNVKSKNFTWSTSFNLSIPRNKLVSFPGLAYNSSYVNNYVIGQPIQGVVKLYHFTGVDPQTGIYTFQDVNNDGKLSNLDQHLVFIGQNYYGGFSNSFTYRNWELDVLFQFVKQTGRSYLSAFTLPGVLGNTPAYVLSRWQQPGDQTPVSKYTTGAGAGGNVVTAWANVQNSDASVVDASFIRLKNISFSYSIPRAWQQSAHLKNGRIYVEAQNLITFTNYLGFDPETQGLNLPPLRMITLGLRASF